MDPKRAKEVLEGMDLDVFSNKQLIREFDYLNVEAGETTSDSDGTLTADEHEAIATWTRERDALMRFASPKHQPTKPATLGRVGSDMKKQTKECVLELCAAAERMLEAANNLWWAHNPDEDLPGDPPSIEDAQVAHSCAFSKLAMAKARTINALSKETPNPVSRIVG